MNKLYSAAFFFILNIMICNAAEIIPETYCITSGVKARILGEKINYMVDFSLAIGNVLKNINYVVLTNPKIAKPSLAKSTINNDNKKGICMYLLGNNNLKWYLNIPLLTIGMKYEISLYIFLLILLLAFSLCKNYLILALFIIIELVLLNL